LSQIYLPNTSDRPASAIVVLWRKRSSHHRRLRRAISSLRSIKKAGFPENEWLSSCLVQARI
jgi:hypothetical protein